MTAVITWFLLGGDLYKAYTFIAVPALVFGMGAIGFFALPYTWVPQLLLCGTGQKARFCRQNMGFCRAVACI